MTLYLGSDAYIIPLNAVSNQTVNCNLQNQSSQINVYQKTTGLFLDLYVNNTLIIGGVRCLWGNWIVRDAYLGFLGDLTWMDLKQHTAMINGTVQYAGDDPICTGIGNRWFLIYVPPS